jgi:DNA-binding Lrp family transcriptional regulator
MDKLDREILKLLTSRNETTATIAKEVLDGSKKSYQQVKYRIENMVEEGILENGDGIIKLPHQVFIGVLSLVTEKDNDYREVEVGTVIRIEKNGKEGFILLDEMGE